MKKIVFAIILQVFFCSLAFGQDSSRILLRASYHFTGTPNPNMPERKTHALLYLDISSSSSYFYDPGRREGDSLFAADMANGAPATDMLSNLSRYRTRNSGFQALNQFGKAKIQIWDNLGVYFSYEEKLPLQNWELKPDTMHLLGLLSYKATAKFRGREFIAWYSPDISVPAGPWKFSGLPGLILKVNDTQSQYTYECTGIEKMAPLGLQMPKSFISEPRKVTYPEFAKLRRTRAEDPAGFFNSISPGTSFTPSGGGASGFQAPKPFNPIELEDK